MSIWSLTDEQIAMLLLAGMFMFRFVFGLLVGCAAMGDYLGGRDGEE